MKKDIEEVVVNYLNENFPEIKDLYLKNYDLYLFLTLKSSINSIIKQCVFHENFIKVIGEEEQKLILIRVKRENELATIYKIYVNLEKEEYQNARLKWTRFNEEELINLQQHKEQLEKLLAEIEQAQENVQKRLKELEKFMAIIKEITNNIIKNNIEIKVAIQSITDILLRAYPKT